MKSNQYGEIILDENDLCDLVMQGRDLTRIKCVVDRGVDIESAIGLLEDPGQLVEWRFPYDSDISVPDWDRMQQRNWHMPDQYREFLRNCNGWDMNYYCIKSVACLTCYAT